MAQEGEPAPSEADVAKAREHFKKASELFEAKDFDGAIVEFIASYKLSKKPVLLYNIAFTYDQLGNSAKALTYYRKFLREAPTEAPNREHAKKRAAELATEKPTTKSQPDQSTGDAPPDKAPVDSFEHMVVEAAPPSVPLDLTCAIPDGSDWTVVLYYRPSGSGAWASVKMQKRYRELVGRIPGSLMTEGSMQYYIVATDETGSQVANSGRKTSPNLVLIEDEAKSVYYPDLDDKSFKPMQAVDFSTESDTADGGITDVGSTKFEYAKWGTTGAAAAFVGLGLTFGLLARDHASTLEGEAEASRSLDQCASGPPCRVYSDKQRSLITSGERYALLANISFGVGVVAAAGAGYFWYLQLRGKREDEAPPRADDDNPLSVVPVLGKDVVGAGAQVRF